jgi:hypothetical protein
VEDAVALETAAMRGLARPEPAARALVAELGGHLRAVLRDVLCGHLDPDLVGVAEGLLEDATTDERDALAAEPAPEADPPTEAIAVVAADDEDLLPLAF